jgi:gamma-tubulin complex component 4
LIPSPTPSSSPQALIVAPSLAEYLHPGEVSSLNTLGQLAFRYTYIRSWARDVQSRGREAVLRATVLSTRKGKQREVGSQGDVPDVYLSTLASGVLDILNEYEILVVTTESRVLALDPALVQDDQTGYVPLSSLIATFDPWQAPLASLSQLVHKLSSPISNSRWTPGKVMEELYDRTQNGHPKIRSIYEKLLSHLYKLFLIHLQSFLLYGLSEDISTPTAPVIGLDTGSDPLSPRHRVYRLNDDLIPRSVVRGTRESILYVGRVSATLRREGRALPEEVLGTLRDEFGKLSKLEEDKGLDSVIRMARAEVGE